MINRRLAAAVLGGASVTAVLVGTASAAHAASYPPGAPACSFSATTVANGDSETAACTGLTPGDAYNYEGHSAVVLFATNTPAVSSSTVTFTIRGLSAGPHHLAVVDATTGTSIADQPITVVAASPVTPPTTTTTGTGSSSGSLPFTGADVAAMSVAGAALIVGGGAAYAAGARRKRRSATTVA